MRKTRLFSILALLLMAATGAWADTVVLGSPDTSVATLSDENGIITLSDATNSTGIQQGSGSYKISYGDTEYRPMKLSASRDFTLSFKAGVTINKVTLMAMSNGDAGGNVGGGNGDSSSLGTFPSRNTNGNCVTLDITNNTGLRFSRQALAIIVVEYTTSSAPATGYSVTLADGTEDADKWTISPKSEGLSENDQVTITYTGTKRLIGFKAEKKSNNPYANAKLGDLFYSDGTFSTTLEAGKTPIGVIAYLDQEGTDDDEICEKSNGAGHGLVLCLKNAASGEDAQWSTEKSAFEFGEDAKVADVNALKRTTNVSGYTNTKTLAEKTDAATNYKVAYAAKNYAGLTAPTGTTGWFLPSAQQWMKMQTGLGALEESVFTWNSWFDTSHTAADKWEAALSKAGSGNYDSMTSAYLFCWSSSEYSGSSAVGLYVGAQGTGYNYGFRWLFRTKDDESDGNRVRPVLAF